MVKRNTILPASALADAYWLLVQQTISTVFLKAFKHLSISWTLQTEEKYNLQGRDLKQMTSNKFILYLKTLI